MKKLSNKTVLVTGGASGIGRLMSLKMAAKGARLVIWDINQANLDRVVAEIRAITPDAGWGYIVDVTKPEAVYQAADKVRAECGKVDVLVNNAGIVSGKMFLDVPDERIEMSLKVNTLAHFWTTKAFLPAMLESDCGHVVTIASAAGLVGVAGLGDYNASKFAAVGFNESLRAEMKKRGSKVTTTVVCPFFIDTGMFDGVKTKCPLLLPILKEQYAADMIVKAIESDRELLMMPRILATLPVLRILPPCMFDRVVTWLGVNSSMDEFKGRH
ncbi:MAG TPA: SDR family oxidoreductase [Myxococcota bacterium]|nr:SDR family oxidoreductase [Myxococcota bacterium]HOA14521.1 SDR family oxidoreductase [Myxococcota bacterium]HOH77857.1 SDR family oxidoreductase [Myxococcota bacterium]HPV04054.1 SDR family oxidoreductase [Myxococcota bacterium]